LTFNWVFPRGVWQDPKVPVVGPNPLPARVNKVVVHYTAASRIPQDICQYLRDMQAAYVRSRGYSLGYNCAVDQAGNTYEIRGFDIRCAANSKVNESSFAVLVLVDGDARASEAAVGAVCDVVAAVERWVGDDVSVVGHGDVGATACPGAGLRQDIAQGLFVPSKLSEEIEMIVLDYEPNTPKWVRFAWDGVQRLAHVASGHVAAIHQEAGVRVVRVSRTQLDALLREPATVKLGNNPFSSGGAADRQLSAAWGA